MNGVDFVRCDTCGLDCDPDEVSITEAGVECDECCHKRMRTEGAQAAASFAFDVAAEAIRAQADEARAAAKERTP